TRTPATDSRRPVVVSSRPKIRRSSRRICPSATLLAAMLAEAFVTSIVGEMVSVRCTKVTGRARLQTPLPGTGGAGAGESGGVRYTCARAEGSGARATRRRPLNSRQGPPTSRQFVENHILPDSSAYPGERPVDRPRGTQGRAPATRLSPPHQGDAAEARR